MIAALFLSVLACAQDPARVDPFARASRGEEFALAARGEEDVLAALVAEGESAVVEAFAGWSAHEDQHRVRAHVIELAGRPSDVTAVLALLGEPGERAEEDPRVRLSFVRFLSRAELGAEQTNARVDRLAGLLRADPDAAVRAAAARALAEIDHPEALARLDAAIAELRAAERAQAAALLASSVRGRALAFARLQELAFLGTDPLTFAALLPPCGRAMAETPGGAATAAERAPIHVGLRHPDARVQRAAQLALDVLIGRLVGLQQGPRAATILAKMQHEGLDPRLGLQQRARIALLEGISTEANSRDSALEIVRELDRVSRSGPAHEARAWSARAAQLEGLTQLAAGDATAAAEPLARAARLFDALVGERIDLRGKQETAVHVRWLEERAIVELAELVRSIVLDVPGGATAPPEAVEPYLLHSARKLHAIALEAQMYAARADLDSPRTLDAILLSDTGPLELVLDVRKHAAWPAARSIAVRLALGRVLAGVAPFEMIGFEPYMLAEDVIADPNSSHVEPTLLVHPPVWPDPTVTDPLRDPLRIRLLTRTGVAEGDRLAQERAKLRLELLEHMARPAGIEPEENLRYIEIEMRLQDSLETQRKVADGETHELLELRAPSSFVTWTARALRDENRALESRPLLLRARAELDASDIAQRFYWGTEMLAEIEIMLGGSYTDAGDPKQAEMQMEKAVERLLALEDALLERGQSRGAVNILRNQRCSTLVSLAVNANVRMRDPVKALEWFEKAWAIRQDDSMRVLLACYRARGGKALEARALLRSVEPGPATWYNFACTYALLGEKEPAFEYLRRELEENQPTAGALEKQKAWARQDPDLESLHGDPRFDELVGQQR